MKQLYKSLVKKPLEDVVLLGLLFGRVLVIPRLYGFSLLYLWI